MARIHPMVTGGAPIGVLFGNQDNARLLDEINHSLGTAQFFGSAADRLASLHNDFLHKVVAPLQNAAAKMMTAVGALLQPDMIRPLTTIDALRTPPPCMQLPILLDPRVMTLFQQGRIGGYGFDPENLKGVEDFYGRLINNGTVDDFFGLAVNGKVTFVEEYHTTDPNLSLEELDYIDETRRFIAEVLDTTDLDPTDIDVERG